MPDPINVHQVFARYFPGIEAWAYAVSEALEQGSICLDIDAYRTAICQQTRKNPFLGEVDEFGPERLSHSAYVTTDPSRNLKPFVVEDGKLYMHRYFTYQSRIVKKIKDLAETEKEQLTKRKDWLQKHRDYIYTIFTSNQPQDPELTRMESIDWQKVAALNTCLNNFSIITGGPGTGKTTTVARILAILFLQNPELKVALAAPTGKAAVRMAESLHQAKETIHGLPEEIRKRFDTIQPRTIHRLLESLPLSTLFRHNEENPLEYDLLIIDEASMADGGLMHKLLDAIRPEHRIIFLGDRNQLASVEAGSIFGDLCRTQVGFMNQLAGDRFDLCNRFLTRQIPDDYRLADNHGNSLSGHIIQLYRNYRTESRDISTACGLIIENKRDQLIPFISNKIDKNGINFDETYDAKLFNDRVLAYREYIEEPDIRIALRKLNRFRVLCAVREGIHGVYQINRNIERELNSKIGKPELFKPVGGFYHNQLIMVTSNNYDLGVFNGDTGIVRRRSQTDHALVAWFESADPDNPKEILPGYLNDWETAYAMTIHKSQGSEFEEVAIVLPENENSSILTRELLYTAVSRAKRRVLIQTTEKVLLATAERQVSRASGIGKQS